MELSQEKIDKIYKIVNLCATIIFFAGLILICVLPKHWGKWPFVIWIVLFAISVIVSYVLRHFATDDEEEQKKKLIKEAVREVAEEQPIPTILPIQDVYDPFAEGVSDEQKKDVKQMLFDLPPHHEKKDCINMSEVSRYLTALEELKIINPSKSADVNSLRTWVEQVTGKHAPKQFHFNDAFPSTNKPGVKKAKEKIKQILGI